MHLPLRLGLYCSAIFIGSGGAPRPRALWLCRTLILSSVMKRLAMCACAVLAGLALTGCDAWPTNVVNHATMPVQFRWHHSRYDDWSAPVAIQPGQSVRLARAHYLEDFSAISISENGELYSPSAEKMRAFRRTCARSAVDHGTTIGHCEITYLGDGVFTVRRIR